MSKIYFIGDESIIIGPSTPLFRHTYPFLLLLLLSITFVSRGVLCK